jgi:small multidrug resistance pump
MPPTIATAWVLLMVAVLAEVVATLSLKLSDGMRVLVPSCIVLVGYGTAFFLMAQVLRTLPVAVVYAVWSGLGIAITAAVAWLWFREALRASDLLGMVLVVAGVLLLARGRGLGETVGVPG